MVSAVVLVMIGMTNPKSHPGPAALRTRLDSIASSFHGTLGYSLHNLKNGDNIERLGDDRFPTASTIKVAIMCAAFDKQQKGEIGYFDRRPITAADVRGGSGLLQFYKADQAVELKELLHLMITMSDNTATVMLVRWLSSMYVNGWLDSHGLKSTRLLNQLPEGETALRELAKKMGSGSYDSKRDAGPDRNDSDRQRRDACRVR